MRRLIRDENGAVHVYAILLIVPIFLFHAIMIDWLRVWMASHAAELAVKAGARSTLSGFDESLRAYGLFGLVTDENDLTQTFDDYMDANLPESSPGKFSLIDPRREGDGTVRQAMSLANRPVLERQIMQEMKLKAPIEFALQITDKWQKSGLAAKLKGTNAFASAAEALEESIHRREQAMDEAWDVTQAYLLMATEIRQSESARLEELYHLADEIGLTTVQDIRSSLESIGSELESGYNTLRSLRDTISSIEVEASDLLKKGKTASGQVDSLLEHAEQLRNEASSLESSLAELEGHQQSMKELLDKSLRYAAESVLSKTMVDSDFSRLRDSYDQVVVKLQVAKQLDEQVAEAMEREKAKLGTDFPESAEAFSSIRIYGQVLFSRYETEAGKITALLNGVRQSWKQTALFAGSEYRKLADGLEQMGVQIEAFRIEKNRDEQERTAANLKRAGQEQSSKEQAGQAVRLAVAQLTGCTTNNKDIYEQLQASAHRYRSFTGDDSPEVQRTSWNEGFESAKASIGLGSLLADKLKVVRDELYVNEYIMQDFGYRTGKGAFQRTFGAVQHEEVEYIVYGLSSCASNYAAAYGEMFSLLTAVRTTEQLLSPQQGTLAAGSPLLAFLAALAEGAIKAVSDMKTLLDGGSVPLFAKAPNIQVTYADFLRMFLVLHGGNTAVIARMQSLIEMNTGTDLASAFTYVQATAATSVRLWFTSRIFRLMDLTAAAPCTPDKGRCRLQITAVSAYE